MTIQTDRLSIRAAAQAMREEPTPYAELIPRAWYMVARSADIPRRGPRRVLSRDLMGHPLVLFRSADGTLHALDAHCPHMGTHLGSATVKADCLVCPMHHWSFDGGGRFAAGDGGGGGGGLRAWPVAERFGAVFVFLGEEPLFDLPCFSLPEESLVSAAGRSVAVQCPWVAVSANAFDMQHLRTVHGRALRQPPVVEAPDGYRLRLTYVSRVTGTGLADRIMKRLSGDHIHVTITCCGGPLFTVESRLKARCSMLLLGIMPTATGVEITPVFVRKKGPAGLVDRFGLAVAGWLFTRFLEKDLSALHRMRFHAPLSHPTSPSPAASVATADPLRQYLDFVGALPRAAADDSFTTR